MKDIIGKVKNMMKEVKRRKFYRCRESIGKLTIPSQEKMVNKSICPLCGKPNDCYTENSKDPKDCWCNDVIIPKEMFELVPKEALHQACICKACIQKFKASKKSLEEGSSKST